MKQRVIGFAILMSACSLAHAQTNVDIYGIIDTGYIKVAGSDLRMGHNYSSRIGFRGSEELGSGMRATFQLEHRLELNSGQNGMLPDYDDQVHARPRGSTEYQGAANMGLAGSFGHVRFGRVNAPGIETYRALDPFFFVGSGRSLGYETRLYAEQITNTVRYDTPAFNGLSGSFTFSLKADDDFQLTSATSNPQTAATNNYGYSALVKYSQNNLTLMAHAARITDSNQSWYVNTGGSYRFGSALVGLGYQYVRDKANFPGFDVTNQTCMLTLDYFVGNGVIKAAWNYGRISNWAPDNNGSANKWVLGYTHNLSKRVTAYAIASYTRSGNEAVGSQYNPNYSSRESASAFQLGMTYRF